jgi:DNA polymerase
VDEKTRRDKLATLHRGIRRCRKCGLHRGRTHAVPGEGPADAAVLFVGEGPGEREDRSGRPFCGRAGDHLDEVLAATGLVRERIFLTSCVKCRPPKNRPPRREELVTCRRAWLERQIACIDPGLVVLLGRTAAERFLPVPLRLDEANATLRRFGGRAWMATYHPAAAMRFPRAREGLDEGLRKVAAWYRECGDGQADR